MEITPSIKEFFKDKNVFITGGSGFMGKVLVEKLLRSCPDLKAIYILLRPKKGKNLDERVQLMSALPLFDRLKKEHPENIHKIKPIAGDVLELGLGLSPVDRAFLIENVNVVYHAAASVRFDDPLKDAIIVNTRSTREVATLAGEMTNLAVFAHISTTYCNTDKQEIEEIIYPAHANWQDSIALAEEADPHTLQILTEKYISPLPNTYTFTKGLAEHVVKDLCTDRVPALIFRPSIVISTIEEPMKGWTDNFNGPVGIFIACGKGVLRSIYTNPNVVSDYMPVDIAVKALILATWHKAITKDTSEIAVYNASNNKVNCVSTGNLCKLGEKICAEIPLNNVLWYPYTTTTQCKYYHYLNVLFYHLIPALLIDGLLKISGNKPMLLKIQRKIYIANMALSHFIENEWTFKNEKLVALETVLLPQDKADFEFMKHENVDPYEYFQNCTLGGRKYLLKEDDSTLPQAKIHSKRMLLLAYVTELLVRIVLFYYIFVKINIIGILVNKYFDMYEYFTSEL